MFKNIFSMLDLTPQKLPFFKIESSTNLGITFSFFTYLMILIYISSSDAFYRRNPKIIKTVMQDNSNNIGIEDGDLICLNIFDDNHNYFSDPQTFSIEVTYSMFNPITKMKESQFIRRLNTSEGEDKNQIDFCFRYDHNENSIDFDDPYYLNKELTISLILCNTSEIANNCKSSDKIKEFFYSVKYIKTTFTKKVFDPSDYISPFKDHIYTLTQKIHFGTYIKHMHYLKNVEVYNDDGILFPYFNKLSAIAFDHSEKDFSLNQEPRSNLIDVSFLSSGKLYTYKRSYEKFPEIFAGIVGLLHLGMFSCCLFNKFPRDFKFMKSIIRTKFAIDYYRNLDKADTILKFRSPRTTQLRPKRKKISGGINPKLGGLSSIAFQQSEYLFNDSKLKSYLLFSISDRKSDKNKQQSKDLKSDSFILDHYSVEGGTEREGLSSPSPNKNINSLDLSGKEKDKEFFYIKTAKLDKQLNFTEDDKLAYNNKASMFVNSLSKLFALTHSKPMFKFGNYLKYKTLHFLQGKKKSKENLLFMKAEKICKKELDVKRMISKLNEIELIKYLLFDSDQLALIDVLRKKTYDPELIDFPRNKNTSQTKENLIKSYDRVFSGSKVNDANLRLIKLCEDL